MSSTVKVTKQRKLAVVNVAEQVYVDNDTSLINELLEAANSDAPVSAVVEKAPAKTRKSKTVMLVDDVLVDDAPEDEAPEHANADAAQAVSKRKSRAKKVAVDENGEPVVKPRAKKSVALVDALVEDVDALVEDVDALVEDVSEPVVKTRKPRAKKEVAVDENGEPIVKTRKPRAKKVVAEPVAVPVAEPVAESERLSLILPEHDPFTPSVSEEVVSDTHLDVEVEETTVDGVLYYKDASGQLYDHDTFAIINK